MPIQLFIDPQGNDTWSGTFPLPNAAGTDGPLASLTGARDVLRAPAGTRHFANARAGADCSRNLPA